MFSFIREWRYSTHPARIESKCRRIVFIGSKAAFLLFKDEEVRQFLKFNEVDETEQDRFFNEMVVTNLVMFLLVLDEQIIEAESSGRKEYLRVLRENIPPFYYSYLKELGIAAGYVEMWEKLVKLRYDEYDRDRFAWRRAFMDIDYEAATNKQVMIFQTVAFGLYDHLRRGHASQGDPLFKRIQHSLFPIYKEFMDKIYKIF